MQDLTKKGQIQTFDLMASLNERPDEKRVVGSYLFQDDNTLNEFMKMPLGKALEWYARTRQMSRGRIIYATPLFKELFTQEHMRFPYDNMSNCMISTEISPIVNAKDRAFNCNYPSDSSSFLCNISPNNTTCCMFDEDYDGISNTAKIDGHELEAFLDEIANQLFLLSKNEIITLINISNKQVFLRDDIKIIRKITKNSPLQQWRHHIRVKCLDIVDPASYVKKIDTHRLEDIEPYMSQGFFFAIPFFLKLLSSYIQQSSFIRKNITHHVAHTAVAHSPFLSPLLVLLCDYILYPRQEPDHLKTTLMCGGGLSLWSCGISYLPSLILPINSLGSFLGWCISLPLIWRPTFDLLHFCYKIYKNEHWKQECISLQELINSPPRCLWRGGRIL